MEQSQPVIVKQPENSNLRRFDVGEQSNRFFGSIAAPSEQYLLRCSCTAAGILDADDRYEPFSRALTKDAQTVRLGDGHCRGRFDIQSVGLPPKLRFCGVNGQLRCHNDTFIMRSGEPCRIRTCDPLIKSLKLVLFHALLYSATMHHNALILLVNA